MAISVDQFNRLKGATMNTPEASSDPGEHTASASTVVPGVNDNFTEPRWMSPHDTHVFWPDGWTDTEKAYWLAKEFHVVDGIQRGPAAAMYAGPTSLHDGFSWETYNPEDHVLVHVDTFYEFIQAFGEVDALTKGMKTVNRKRRKQNQVQRRIERRLNQARQGREQLRSAVETERRVRQTVQDSLTHRLVAQRATTTAWKQHCTEQERQLTELRSQLEAAQAELTALKTATAASLTEPVDAVLEANGWTAEHLNTPLDEITR